MRVSDRVGPVLQSRKRPGGGTDVGSGLEQAKPGDTRSRIARRAERYAASPAASRVVLDPLLSWGWRRYQRDGRTPPLAYRAMRTAFLAPEASFRRLEERAAREEVPLAVSSAPAGLLAGIHDDVLVALERDGVAVLPSLLPAPICDDIERAAWSAVCALVGPGGVPGGEARFDPQVPRSRRYDIPETDLLACNSVQELLADESLLRLAQDYIGSAPVHDLVAGWWSAPGAGSAAKAAQLFHFDLDRPRFVKLFVYLTDVGQETGPHAFVRGTHRFLPSEFRGDRRYSDEEVERRFRSQVLRLAGPRGTVFLADTRGLHKGEPVVRGHRLVFQLELASSLFGQTYTRPVLSAPNAALAQAVRRFPSAYRRFTVAEG